MTTDTMRAAVGAMSDERIKQIAEEQGSWGVCFGYTIESEFEKPSIPKHAYTFARAIEQEVRAALEEGGEPINMLLFCPDCGEQHIDAPEEAVDRDDPDNHCPPRWTNPPHKSHLCHGCGCIWRPANVPTNGVAGGIPRGKADTWLLGDGAIPTAPTSLEALIRACYDDAACFPEAEDPRTGDWMYDDNHLCGDAIRKRGIETAREYVEMLAASPTAAPKEEGEPVAWRWKYGDTDHHPWVVMNFLPPKGPVFRLEPLYTRPIAADTQGDAKDAGWVSVPRIGTIVRADHPVTCLNPEPTFEVFEVRAERDGSGFAVRGENTCWFGIRSIRPSLNEGKAKEDQRG